MSALTDRKRNSGNHLSIVIVAAITLVFTALALFNMGTFHIPISCWQPAAGGDGRTEMIVQLQNCTSDGCDVSAIYVFLCDANATKFEVFSGSRNPHMGSNTNTGDTSNISHRWRKVLTYDNSNDVRFCNWVRLALNRKTDMLKFVFEPTYGKIGEILIISAEGHRIPVRIGSIKSTDTADKSADNTANSMKSIGDKNISDPRNIFDEQDEIELPITQKNGAYFDEMYFVRTAWEYLHLEEPYETTHPPLGKLIIALGIILFGMNPFGWRVIGVIAAAAMIPVMFLFARRLFGSNTAGYFAAYLLAFDFMHFSLARLATGEIYLFFFSLLTFFFFHEYLRKRQQNKAARMSLFISIVCCGLWFAVKWTAFYGFLTIIILFLLLARKEHVRSDFNVILAGVFASAAIYIATYIPYMLSGHPLFDMSRLPLYMQYVSEYLRGGTVNITTPSPLTVFDLQIGMFLYHASLNATHPFSSPWWSWPLILKPLWMFVNTEGNTVSTVVLMGNPVIWWSAIPAIAATSVAAFVRHEKITSSGVSSSGAADPHNEATAAAPAAHSKILKQLFIIIPFFSLWLPYALIPRILFIYHFAPATTFLILAVTYWLELLWEDKDSKALSRSIVITYLIFVAAVFVMFYPVISGMPVSPEYRDSLKWLPQWYF